MLQTVAQHGGREGQYWAPKTNHYSILCSQMPVSRKPFRMMIGPVILDDRTTGQNYLDFLQNELPKQLEDIPLATRIAMCFQHDRAPSHYTRHVMQHLNDTFPTRWIGRGSNINWPPRSPDLTPLHFCLWGLMKSELYRKKSGDMRRTAR